MSNIEKIFLTKENIKQLIRNGEIYKANSRSGVDIIYEKSEEEKDLEQWAYEMKYSKID